LHACPLYSCNSSPAVLVKATEAKMFNYQTTYRLKIKFQVMPH
jgi:hypothetical protein